MSFSCLHKKTILLAHIYELLLYTLPYTYAICDPLISGYVVKSKLLKQYFTLQYAKLVLPSITTTLHDKQTSDTPRK